MIKNITLSADEELIKKARERAARENRSLNDAFREWMTAWTEGLSPEARFDTIMQQLSHVDSGRRFNRDELNAR